MTSTLDFISRDTPVDLTNCDREPIHIPGAIQPHGALLVLREPDLTILQVSANTGGRLGIPPDRLLGSTLATHVGEAQAAAVVAPLSRGATRAFSPIALTLAGATGARTFDGVVHRSGDVVVLELEPHDGTAPLSYATFYEMVRETMAHIERADSLAGLAGAIADQMWRLTGFDRVWVYKFHEDWHGEIIGEAKRDDIETWLGMHYPASDIPAQARALFLKHWLRMIPDMGFTPVPLVPRDDPRTGDPLDMGSTVLRSVSPIHVQYLQNMGVTASLVVSLVRGGRLWGLISGHHYSGPKFVPYATRTLCEFLAQSFSTQLGVAERAEDAERTVERRAVQQRLVERLGRAGSLGAALAGEPALLLDLVGASGAAVCVGGDVALVGDAPPREWVERLVCWVDAQRRPVLATSALPAQTPLGGEQQALASGLLAIHVSAVRPDYVLWFRAEARQTVRWAGDPRKPVLMTEDGVERLQPRGSFELWEETVRGTAAAWLAVEVDMAAELRSTIIDVLLRRADEIERLNEELEAANEQLQRNAVELEMATEELEMQTEELRQQTDELLTERDGRERALAGERQARDDAERANQAKAEFLAMMSHELRTPLNAIGGYAQLIELGIRGPTTPEQREDLGRIQTSQRHLLGLINGILNFARLEAGQVQFTPAVVPLAAEIETARTLVEPQLRAKAIASSWHACATGDDAPVAVWADEEKLRQILLNLLSNAIKFTAPGGRVDVTCALDGERVRIDVRDTGRGIAPDHVARVFEPFVQVDRRLLHEHDGVGLGLAISRDLARGMGGDLTVESTFGAGSTFTLTVPRAPVDVAAAG